MRFPHIKRKEGFKDKLKRIVHRSTFGAASLVAAAPLFFAPLASAASPVVVTPTDTHGWAISPDNTAGGTVDYVADPTAPAGSGALRLQTDLTPGAKAQYIHETNTPLSNINELSYYTKQNSASFAGGDPSYQLVTYLNGGNSGYSTLVYEPYQNLTQGPVVPGSWQSWDVAAGLFWSTRTVTCSNGVIAGTAGGPATYTLAQLQTTCPQARVAAFDVNVGGNNPEYNVETDLFNFNGTTYDFEQHNVAHDKNQCKNDGYKNVTDADGNGFKNQGQCVSYTNGRGSNGQTVVLANHPMF